MTFKLITLLSLAAAVVAAPAPVGGGLGAAGEGTKCSFDVSITEVCHASTIEGYAEVLPIDSPERTVYLVGREEAKNECTGPCSSGEGLNLAKTCDARIDYIGVRIFSLMHFH